MDRSARAQMHKRRFAQPVTAQAIFEDVLTGELHWPGRTVRLERDSILDYRHRHASANISVAEFYHENSKLFPRMLPEIAVSPADARRLRATFVARRAQVARIQACPEMRLDQRYHSWLSGVAAALRPEDFYAVDVRIVADGLIAVLEPVTVSLMVVKHLTDGALQDLQEGIALLGSVEPLPTGSAPLALLTGSFARNEILLGPRGYRRTLLDAGRMAQEMLRQARPLGISAQLVCEFADQRVDEAADMDGIEQGTLMALQLKGDTHEFS
jgi:hypothetical protein